MTVNINSKENEFIIEGLERNFAGLTLENPTESSLSKIKRFYNNQEFKTSNI